VRYPFIKQSQGQFTLSALCRVMPVARSGDYAWRTRPVSAREAANRQLTQQIKTVFEASQQT
jgi:putative transposase